MWGYVFLSEVKPMLSERASFRSPDRRGFRKWLAHLIAPRTRRPARPGYPLHLEALEERTLLNNRFVVPTGVLVDNLTNFATLQAALTTAGLASGDNIQIQAGSSPGNIVNANLPAVTNLTIKGDPAAGLLATPQFNILDAVTIATNQAGFTLQGVNVGLTGGGSITFNANASILGSSVIDVSSNAVAAITLNGSADVLSGSTFSNNAPLPIHTALVLVTPPGGSNNLITGNTFTANASVDYLLAYQSTVAVTITDQVTNNTFLGSAGSNVGVMLFVGAPINNLTSVAISGLSIQGNHFSDPDTDVIALELNLTGTGTVVARNQISLTASTILNRGILILANELGTTTSASVAVNVINTAGAGTGLEIDLGADVTSVANLQVQGNDFHSNRTGVAVIAPSGSAAPLAGIDLGGGSQGSLGDNNFSSFTSAGFNAGAIVLTNISSGEGTLKAQRNIFASGLTAATVITDPNTNVDSSNALTGNAAFVASLYNDVLHRAGDTTNPQDAGSWISALNANTLTPSAVASAVARSGEALGVLVDGLYLKLLNRASDPTGRASFINLLQTGGTVEQAIIMFVASGEYASRYSADSAFVQSLYNKLLGRVGSSAEVNSWVSGLQTGGLTRAAVGNGFVASGEFRSDVVEELYGFTLAPLASVASLFPNLLHRAAAPTSAEVSGWVNSGFDILTIEVNFAASGEFQNGGSGQQITTPAGLTPLDRHAPIVSSLLGEGFSTIPPTGPAELNPYGVAFAPANFPTTGTLQPGDLLVANFNNPANTQGTGTTIVRITPTGQRSTFFTSTQLGLDAGLAVLQSGFVIVANLPNVSGAPGQGSLQILDNNGAMVKTLTDANLIDGPWDLTVNDQGSTVQVFVSTLAKGISATAAPNGTVTRIDLSISGGVITVQDMVQIASGYATRTDAAAFVVGPAGLAFNATTGTLYMASEAEKVNGVEVGTIFAVANAGTTTTDGGKGTVVFADATHLHGPVGLVLLPNGDLMAANTDAVNADSKHPSELVEFTTAGRFVNEFSIDPANAGPFSIAVSSASGKIRFAALNDNQNTVTVWNLVPTYSNPYVVSTIPPTGPAELNPYGVAIAPPNFPTTGTLQPGDMLVANFNNSSNVQGTGSTLVRITSTGQRSTFFTSTQLGLDAGLAILQSGFVVVANIPVVNNTPGQGAVQILDSNGTVVSTLTDPNLLNGPWDLAVNDQGNKVQIFVSTVSKGITPISNPNPPATANGTVTRIDLAIQKGMPVVQDMIQIASGYANRSDNLAFVVGPAGLAFDPRTGTLYVASEAERVNGNEVGTIFAIANASLTSGDHGKGTLVFADPTHLHGPLGLALAPNGDLIAANNDSVNVDTTQPSTLVEFTAAGQFVGQFSLDPVIDGPFSLAVLSSGGQLSFAALNNNQNTVSLWSFQTGIGFPAAFPGSGQILGF
jgi:hypothetical protein